MTRRASLLAVLFLLAVDCAFLFPALFTSSVRAPADVTLSFPPFLAELPGAPPHPRNELLNDWLVQFHPWQHLVRDAYAEGRVPLWNDRAGCGEPLLANSQCEALSPYLPLLLLTGDQYVDWRQLAQLVVAQLFCLLLASELGLSAIAGAIVALTYSFSSFMQIWAIHPHSASASFAPGILWALLRVAAVPSAGRVFVAALCVAFSLLSGHVETAAKAGVVAGAVAFLHAMLKKPPAGRLRFTILIGVAALAGLMLAACLLVPFFDYLEQSDARELRPIYIDSPLPLSQLVTLLDPDALGSVLATPPTYHGIGSYADSVLHVGRMGVLLAASGILLGFARRAAHVVPLLVVGFLGIAIACDLFKSIVPVASFWSSIPGLGDIWPFRFLYCAILPLALLAGIGFDELARLFARVPSTSRSIAAALIVLTTAATAGLPWYGFLAATPESWLHPASRSLEKLRGYASEGRTIELGRVLPPGFGQLYGVRQLARYDAIGLERFSDLFHVQDGFPIFRNLLLTFAPAALLDATSARWVLSDYPASDARYPTDPWFVGSGAPATFNLTDFPSIDRPVDLVIFRMPFEELRDGSIQVVFDQPERQIVWTLGSGGWTSSGDIGPDSRAVPPEVKEFMAVQLLRFPSDSLSIPTALSKSSTRLTFRVKDGGAPFRLTVLLAGGLGHDVVEADNMGWLRIAERRSAMPYAYLSPRIARALDQEDAARQVRDRGFDPHATTVVELGLGSGDPKQSPLAPAERATIKRFDPGRIEVEVHALADRMLVVTDAFAPGWLATVDGAETTVYAANLVGKSCWVPAGTHTVVMRYAPRSFTIGWAISVATLLGFAAASLLGASRRKRFTASGRSPTTPRA